MGILDWLGDLLFGTEDSEPNKRKRVFISFAVEDAIYRDYLVDQAKKEHSPFELIDMSVKQPWQNGWKKKCRTKIRGCDCVIVLLSESTKNASGVKWEIKCAREDRIPMRVMYVKKNNKPLVPPELKGIKTMEWSWENLENFLN